MSTGLWTGRIPYSDTTSTSARATRPLQLGLQDVGLRVDAGDLAAVGRVGWARRDGPVRARVHVVPPEELGAGEAGQTAARRLPHLLAGDEAVGLPPQPDLRQVP